MAYSEKCDRAKQFAPFDALKGFHEALAAKEKIVVPKVELSDEMKEELDIKLHEISVGDMVSAVYFVNDEYVKVTGIVSKFSETSRYFRIVNTQIPFDDLLMLSKEKTI